MSLEDVIRGIVREEIQRAIGGLDLVYTTTDRTAWPPGCRTRRQARERIRAVPGHQRTGDGPATMWSVDRVAYHAHHARRIVDLVASPIGEASDEQIALEALAAAGLRSTRRAS